MMMDLILLALFAAAGFIAGALVTRNNIKQVNKVVKEAKEVADKINSKK